MNTSDAHKQKIVNSVEQWLQTCVLGLSLCPYARVPFERGKVRIAAYDAGQLSQSLDRETELLQRQPMQIETTLLVLASGFENFFDFNDSVGDIEDMLQDRYLDSQFQLASFHPAFLFGGEPVTDASHYTNRAPYPIVQLLRVESVAKAVDEGDTLAVPERNMKKLRSLEKNHLATLFPWVVVR